MVRESRWPSGIGTTPNSGRAHSGQLILLEVFQDCEGTLGVAGAAEILRQAQDECDEVRVSEARSG